MHAEECCDFVLSVTTVIRSDLQYQPHTPIGILENNKFNLIVLLR
jgi:hypothetical protein